PRSRNLARTGRCSQSAAGPAPMTRTRNGCATVVSPGILKFQHDVQPEPVQGNIPPTHGQTPMKLPSLVKPAARRSRDALRNAYYAMYRQFRRPLPGEYQTYSYTRPDRYPWLFEFAA